MRKRLVSILLVVATLLSLCMPVYAEDPTWDPNAGGGGRKI